MHAGTQPDSKTAPQARKEGDAFGSHRSTDPVGALPQPAQRLDNDFSKLFAGEILIDVDTLNVDAASFRQMEEAAGSVEGVGAKVLETVRTRGKQHNPVTGSGGMLLGRVAAHGPSVGAVKPADIAVGTRIATLISLSLTPLRVDEVLAIRGTSGQVDIKGQAVRSPSDRYA
jgi:L-erythro-3,5-diaminohexanoate dehydrogenase